MIHTTKIFSIIVFVVFTNLTAIAQPLQFTTLTIDNGLNVNSINGIMQDKNGFIWMTTSDGVCRYDGRNFKKMLFDKNKPNSLNSYVYTSIIEDNNGNKWIDGENGVETIDGKSGQVSFIKIEKQNNNVFYFGPDFFVLKDRNIIVRVSVNYTMQIFDERDKKYKKEIKLPFTSEYKPAMSKGLYYCGFMSEDKNDVYIMSNNCQEVAVYNANTDKVSLQLTNIPLGLHLISKIENVGKDVVRFMAVDDKKSMYVVEYSNKQQKMLQKYWVSNNYEPGLNSNYFYDTLAKKSYVGVGGDGLYEYDSNFTLINKYKHDPQNPKSLGGGLYYSNIKRIGNQLWIITNPGGVSFANLEGNNFVNYSSKTGLPDISKGIFTNNQGNIYNIPVGDGIKVYNSQTGQNITSSMPTNVQQQFNQISYYAFNSTVPLGNNRILFKTLKNFLIYNYKTHQFTNYTNSLLKYFNNKNESMFSQAYAIGRDTLLFDNGKALCKVLLNPNATLSFLEETKFPYEISSILQVKKGVRFIGTINGVYKQSVQGEPTLITETKNHLIKHIIEATDGTIYAASLGGVFILSPEGKLIKKLTTANGLSNSFCYTLIEDNLKNIWISNNAGLNRYSPATDAFNNYTMSDGLQGNEFNSNAFYKDSSGRLYFGGVNGVSSFLPEKIQQYQNENNAKLIAFGINDNWFNRDSAIWDIKNITLTHKQNTVTFEFSAMNFVNDAALNFYYKLDGYDKDWVDAGKNTVVRYPDLPHGTYTFLVAISRNGNKSKEAQLITINIKPAFWQTWWFYLLSAITSILFMWKLVQLINKRKYQKKLQALKLQEELETERQRISRDLHDNMGAYTSALIANVQQLKTNIGENEHTQKMQTNAESILNSLRETIWVLNNKEITLQEFNDGFKNYCFKVLRNFEHINFNATENITANPLLKASAAIHLNKIMQEIIQNCIKHAQPTEINYTINDANGLQISIADNGKGFNTKEKSNGFGLENMQWRAREASLIINIDSQQQKGTIVSIKPIN